MDVSTLKPCDAIIVKNGAKGEQVAIVAAVTSNGTARVHKWLARGRRWTNRVTAYECEILRFATQADATKRKVEGIAAIRGSIKA